MRKEIPKKLKVAIVGPGRLGQAMGKLLRESGVIIHVVAARRMEKARRAVRFIGGGRPATLKSPRLAEADVIVITTSDAAIESAARQIAGGCENWLGRVVLHTCGSLPASVLDAFRTRGARVGSLHPYQTVPSAKAGVRNLKGCYWAVEGDRRSKALAKRWVKLLHGTAFEIAAEAKPLYHLSAFLACPTVVTLLEHSARLLRHAGVPDGVARPMLVQFVEETARNFALLGARKALTGPAVRGDWATLEEHVAQLRRYAPEAVPAYRELVRLMLRVEGKAPKDMPSWLRLE